MLWNSIYWLQYAALDIYNLWPFANNNDCSIRVYYTAAVFTHVNTHMHAHTIMCMHTQTHTITRVHAHMHPHNHAGVHAHTHSATQHIDTTSMLAVYWLYHVVA